VNKDYRDFVNGALAKKASPYSLSILDPATHQTLGRVPDSNAAEVDAAVAAAREVQTGWDRLPSHVASELPSADFEEGSRTQGSARRTDHARARRTSERGFPTMRSIQPRARRGRPD
jgi:hypothetical protein